MYILFYFKGYLMLYLYQLKHFEYLLCCSIFRQFIDSFWMHSFTIHDLFKIHYYFLLQTIFWIKKIGQAFECKLDFKGEYEG